MYLCKRTILRSAIDNCEFKLYNKNDKKFIKYDTLGGRFMTSKRMLKRMATTVLSAVMMLTAVAPGVNA